MEPQNQVKLKKDVIQSIFNEQKQKSVQIFNYKNTVDLLTKKYNLEQRKAESFAKVISRKYKAAKNNLNRLLELKKNHEFLNELITDTPIPSRAASPLSRPESNDSSRSHSRRSSRAASPISRPESNNSSKSQSRRSSPKSSRENSPDYSPENDVTTPKSRKSGRPRVSPKEAKSKHIIRKLTSNLKNDYSLQQLLWAAEKKLRRVNREEDANILKNMRMKKQTNPLKSYNSVEALNLVIEGDFSRETYQTVRNGASEKGAGTLYPSWKRIQEAKKRCSCKFKADVDSAETDTQDLFDQTANKIFDHLVEDDIKEKIQPTDTLVLEYKAGFDGSSGQQVFTHKPEHEQIEDGDNIVAKACTETLFLTAMVPLQLSVKASGQIIWRNQKPSSTRMCRPLRFKFVKETQDINIEEDEYLDSLQLEPTVLSLKTTEKNIETALSTLAVDDNNLHERKVDCHHAIKKTMTDGKVHTHLSKLTNSYRCCAICGAKPKEMNSLTTSLELAKKQTTNFEWGISIMHKWIKCMEFILHVAYRFSFKKFGSYTSEDKITMEKTKKRIRNELFAKLGILVDTPKQGGAGNSNAGNTGRRFLKHADEVAQILHPEFPAEVIHRLRIVMVAISCQQPLNCDKFENFCLETFELIRKEFPWYDVPQGVHVLLIHSHQVARELNLPLGMYSEEAQESSNKVVKKFRKFNIRRSSQIDGNFDLMRRLLNASDPELCTYERSKKPDTDLPDEVKNLLEGN